MCLAIFRIIHVFMKHHGVFTDHEHSPVFQFQKVEYQSAPRISGSGFGYVLKAVHADFHSARPQSVFLGDVPNITILFS